MWRLLQLLSVFAGLWPERAVAGFAALAGGLWWHVLRYRRGVILANLAQAFPDRTDAERRALGRAATTHLARTLLELFRLPRLARSRFASVARIEGLEHLEAALAGGRGVLGLTGHLGSFELAAAAVAERLPGAPLAMVVKPFPPAIERFLGWVRTRAGLGLISAKGGMKAILRALASGQMVAFVLDQNATRRLGVFVDFFGKPACTMSALAVIAARTNAPVVPVSMWREPGGRHVIRVHPPIPFERAETRPASIERMTALYTRFIEDRIREHPEQWLWTHKRWRTEPPEA